MENASSGGVIPELLFYLLDKKIVDYVVVTKFEYTENGPITKTVLTKNREGEIIRAKDQNIVRWTFQRPSNPSRELKGK